MAVALDSNVVIGFLDRSDVFHAAADQKVREALSVGESIHTCVVIYAEVLTGAKLGHHDESLVRGFFTDLVTNLQGVDTPVAERAAELRGGRRSLAMVDALVLATADLDPKVDRLICADSVAEKVATNLNCKLEGLTPIGAAPTPPELPDLD